MTKKVLCVGLNCLDIIQFCENFPLEDSDQRSAVCRLQRGGNASNNCTVLSLLGTATDYLGTFAPGPFYNFLIEDFIKRNIGTTNCRLHEGCDFPLTTIIINSKNGSRTILHSNKNLPEYYFEDFKKIDLQQYSWIQFEGRNIDEVEKMINYVNNYNNDVSQKVTISVELELPDEQFLRLVPNADVVFVGKDFARHNGWEDMKSTLEGMKKYVKTGATTIVSWGEEGAMACRLDNTVHSPAHSPEIVVDTLGAGDTFYAAAIHALINNKSLQETVDFACLVAGSKVGMAGYDGLKELFS